VLDDIISVEEARNDYGVVMTEVDDGYGWQVDESATEKLRASMS